MSPHERLLWLNRRMLFGGVAISCAIMYCLLIAGFWSILKGVLIFFDVLPPVEHHYMAIAIHGLEFIFLAPLPYFLLLSVAKYVEVTSPGPSTTNQGADDPQPRTADEAKAELLTVKSFSVTLFIAVFATNLLGKALAPKGLEFESTLCSALLIVVLGLYFVALEKFASSLRKTA
jgi:hypothetical protein